MTETTLTPTGVLTERTWTVAATKRRAERTATYRSAHLTDRCSAASGEGVTVVATGLTVDEVLADWTCGLCVPVEYLGGGSLPIDASEIEAQAQADARQAEWDRKTSGTGTGGHGRPTLPEPTEKQQAFLRSLLGLSDDEWTGFVSSMKATGQWTKQAVSQAIDTAKQQPRPAAAPAATTVEVPAGVEILSRTNRYGGSCVLCGGHVADEAGRLAKRNGKWVVAHNDGDCGTPAPAAERTETPLADVPAGHYAIPSTGDNDLVFYRVDRPTDRGYDGSTTFVKMIVGGHPDQNVRRANVAGILARIAEYGVAESARLYGNEIGRCYRCNRHLTDEVSRDLGIGPECRKHV